MPGTIPNLPLHEKPLTLGNSRLWLGIAAFHSVGVFVGSVFWIQRSTIARIIATLMSRCP